MNSNVRSLVPNPRLLITAWEKANPFVQSKTHDKALVKAETITSFLQALSEQRSLELVKSALPKVLPPDLTFKHITKIDQFLTRYHKALVASSKAPTLSPEELEDFLIDLEGKELNLPVESNHLALMDEWIDSPEKLTEIVQYWRICHPQTGRPSFSQVLNFARKVQAKVVGSEQLSLNHSKAFAETFTLDALHNISRVKKFLQAYDNAQNQALQENAQEIDPYQDFGDDTFPYPQEEVSASSLPPVTAVVEAEQGAPAPVNPQNQPHVVYVTPVVPNSPEDQAISARLQAKYGNPNGPSPDDVYVTPVIPNSPEDQAISARLQAKYGNPDGPKLGTNQESAFLKAYSFVKSVFGF